jgi:lipopolysaccharide export LptBFGC system permease protein LptF
MPSEGFHVHGVHDHAVEHAAEHGDHGSGDKLAGRIAVASALLATLGALMGFAGGDTQAKAQFYKNEAAITKTEANDKWNYYQAKGVKRNTAEVAANLVHGELSEKYRTEAERYKKEQADIKAEADALEEKVKEWNEHSDHEMHIHHRWALGATAMQIAIALSAIALLARRSWLLYAVGVVATGGCAAAAMAMAGI